MKVFLMHPDADFDMEHPLPWNAEELGNDLGTDPLLQSMSGSDPLFLDVAKQALFTPLFDLDVIRYRQEVLSDCLENTSQVRKLYDLAVRVIEGETRGMWGFIRYHPSSVASETRKLLVFLITSLREFRDACEEQRGLFRSRGFRRLFAELSNELDDRYFASVTEMLEEMKFPDGPLISARFGAGNQGTKHALRQPRKDGRGFFARLLSPRETSSGFQINPRDESGARALSEIEDRGMNVVANALQQSVDHIKSYFAALRTELAFYLSASNLAKSLAALDLPVCFPVFDPSPDFGWEARQLYDPALALANGRSVVGNDFQAAAKDLIVVTGANRGGKSTFLRSVGLAQLMAQSGIFVAAESCRVGLRRGIFSHFKREEDRGLTRGKLEEELERMRAIVESIVPPSVVLMNESFASTNEREGSEISRQVIHTLRKGGSKVLSVTHLFDLASSLNDETDERVIFLTAERREDGTRTYRVLPGQPRPTAYAHDLYARIFGAPAGHT